MKMTAKATCRGEMHNEKLEVLVTVKHHQKLANGDMSLLESHNMIEKIAH